jgi:hypothetical protein
LKITPGVTTTEMTVAHRAVLILPMLLLMHQARASNPESDPMPPLETQTNDLLLQGELPPPTEKAMFFTNPSERREELAVHQILPRLYAGAEIEGYSTYEKQGGPADKNAYLDTIAGALRWEPFYGLTGLYEGSYDLHNADGYTVDEATLTLGAVETQPWYVMVGRTALPFGEFNSHFREDPTTQVLGEIQGTEIAGGYQTDTFELTFASRAGTHWSPSYSWIGNLTFSPVEDLDAGAFYTSDLTQSYEIKKLIHSAQADDPTLHSSAVGGVGTFMSLQKERYSIDFEVIAALDRFEPGLLTDSAQRPWAWNFEATVRPGIPWELGIRFERSSGLPDSPEFQFGPETTYSFGPHAAVSLEYLHGTFGNNDSDRDLVTAGLLLRW